MARVAKSFWRPRDVLQSGASEASKIFFQSSPLDWLKMHFRAFPEVKMS